jgi:excisionase family DNA binding protein
VGHEETDEPLLNSSVVAKRVGVTRRTVSQWVQSGRLVPTVTTMGGQYRFRWSDVQDQMRAARESDDW